LLGAFWTAIFFDIIFQCFPHDKRWSQNPAYQCDPKQAEINYWLTILLNIGTDVFTICLPIYMVLQLQMKMKQKIGVAAIFALGFLVVVASIIRAYYSKRNETMLTCTVSMIETAVAIIATCLPRKIPQSQFPDVQSTNIFSRSPTNTLPRTNVLRTIRLQLPAIRTLLDGSEPNSTNEPQPNRHQRHGWYAEQRLAG
jgi:Kef-type K+ transport system membrane component KefB